MTLRSRLRLRSCWDWDALSETERIDLEFYLNSTLEQEYAGDTTDLSAKFFDDGEEFDGDDVLFPQGYKAIVDGLAQGVDIRLSQRGGGDCLRPKRCDRHYEPR